MSSPEAVMQALRGELRLAGLTYRMLAERIGMSESSMKRVFSQGDMSLSRLALVCKGAGISMEEVLRQAADAAPRADELTLPQERSLVADPQLLLVAICCLGGWSLPQIVQTYALNDAQAVRGLAKLDRLGLIELKPGNRYRLHVSRTFRWRPDGPVQQYFREHVAHDYFAGRFDGSGETLQVMHGRLSSSVASWRACIKTTSAARPMSATASPCWWACARGSLPPSPRCGVSALRHHWPHQYGPRNTYTVLPNPRVLPAAK
jgi:hypothetical protein